jgi:hypothetical protein
MAALLSAVSMSISRSPKSKLDFFQKSLGYPDHTFIFAPLKREVMSKKFSTKKMRLRGRAARRRQNLKVNPQVVMRKPTQEEQNRAVIAAIEAKIKA